MYKKNRPIKEYKTKCVSLYENDWQAGLVFSKGTGPQTNLLAPTSFLAHVTHIIKRVA